MAVKKSELYSTLWEGCNKLRGSMDASQYKNYVLIMLFLKYISDKAKAKDIDSLVEVPAILIGIADDLHIIMLLICR